jgi:hypothetical protein
MTLKRLIKADLFDGMPSTEEQMKKSDIKKQDKKENIERTLFATFNTIQAKDSLDINDVEEKFKPIETAFYELNQELFDSHGSIDYQPSMDNTNFIIHADVKITIDKMDNYEPSKWTEWKNRVEKLCNTFALNLQTYCDEKNIEFLNICDFKTKMKTLRK